MGKVVLSVLTLLVIVMAPAYATQWTDSTLSGSDLGLYPTLFRTSSGMLVCTYNQQGDHDSPGEPGSLRVWADANTNGLCELQEIQTIDTNGNTGLNISAKLFPDGAITVAYDNSDSGGLHLWKDDSLNYAYDPGEIEIVDTSGRTPSLCVSPDGKAAIAYQDTTFVLKYWYDANGDTTAQATEIATITSPPQRCFSPSLVFDAAGNAVVAYYNRTAEGLYLWHDIDNSATVTQDEIQVIDSNGRVGQNPCSALTNSGTYFVLYWNSTSDSLRIWHDADGDYTPDAGECYDLASGITSSPRPATMITEDGTLIATWYDAAVSGPRLWKDTNSDFSIQSGELSSIEENHESGYQSSIASANGYPLAVAYYDQKHHDLNLWHDLDDNQQASADEITKIDRSAYNAGIQMKATYDPSGLATLVYLDSTDELLWIWHDNNGNELPEASESHSIGLSHVMSELDMVYHPITQNLLLLYYDENQTLTAWHDEDGDYIPDAGEITIPDGSTGKICSTTYTADGILQTAYYVFPEYDLRFWEDLNQNYQIDEGESFLLDTDGNYVGQYMDIAITPTGNIIAAYEVHYPYYDLRIWYDANGNRMHDIGEIRVIDTPDRTGKYPSIAFDDQGITNILFYAGDWEGNPGDLRYWIDADNDFELDDGEVQTILASEMDTGQRAVMIMDGAFRPTTIFANSTQGTVEFWHDENSNRTIDAGERQTLHSGLPAGEECSLAVRSWDQRVFAAWHDPVNRSLTISFASLPDACLKGDLTEDGEVNRDDVSGMTSVLLGDSTGWLPVCAGDMNSDGQANGLDLQLFLNTTAP